MSTEIPLRQLVEEARLGDSSAFAELRRRSEVKVRRMIDAELPSEALVPEAGVSPSLDLLLEVQCSLPGELKRLRCDEGEDFDNAFDAWLIATVKQRVLFWLAYRHQARLMAYISCAMSDHLRRQDVGVEIWDDTLLTAYQRYSDFRWVGEAAFVEWLLEIAKGKIRDREDRESAARRDYHRNVANSLEGDSCTSGFLPREFMDSRTPGRPIRQQEVWERLHPIILDSLTAIECWALKLWYFEGMAANEAAQNMGISRTYLTTLTHRARRKLRSVLDSEVFRPSK